MSAPKHPEIEVQLSGQEGNAVVIIGRVRRALRQGGVGSDEAEQFTREAMDGSYSDLLRTVGEWVTIS